MDSIEQRLQEKGIRVPAAASPAANYLPWRISGNQLFISGILPVRDGELTHKGAAGADQTVETAAEAARICALNVLGSIKAALGSLDRVRQILFVNGYVNGVSGFAESPLVINGASDFFVETFGEAGRHARAAVAVAGLPKDATVELQVTVEFA